MDFTKYSCPVCDKRFTSDDDIVVCPECGAPHHRECYDSLEHCFYEDKHSESFSYEDLHKEESDNNNAEDDSTVICPVCQTENPSGIFYCQKCGTPLANNRANQNNTNEDNRQAQGAYGQSTGQQNVPPNPMNFMFDPMAGLDSNQPIADNVTAGEMAKFVGKNTPYYLTVFNRLKAFNASKYNFSAFIFSGVYFLYRKMIGIGILLTAIIICLTVGQVFIQQLPAYTTLFSQFRDVVNNSQTVSMEVMNQFSTTEIAFLYLPFILSVVRFAVMIISGAVANRTYYKHCTNKINLIKSEESTQPLNSRLESKGGVNIALAVCAAAIFSAVNFMSMFLI